MQFQQEKLALQKLLKLAKKEQNFFSRLEENISKGNFFLTHQCVNYLLLVTHRFVRLSLDFFFL